MVEYSSVVDFFSSIVDYMSAVQIGPDRALCFARECLGEAFVHEALARISDSMRLPRNFGFLNVARR